MPANIEKNKEQATDLAALDNLTQQSEISLNKSLRDQEMDQKILTAVYFESLMTSSLSNPIEVNAAFNTFLNSPNIDDKLKYEFISKYFRWTPYGGISSTNNNHRQLASSSNGYSGYGTTAKLTTKPGMNELWEDGIMPWLVAQSRNIPKDINMCPEEAPYPYKNSENQSSCCAVPITGTNNCKKGKADGSRMPCPAGDKQWCDYYHAFPPGVLPGDVGTANYDNEGSNEQPWNSVGEQLQNAFISANPITDEKLNKLMQEKNPRTNKPTGLAGIATGFMKQKNAAHEKVDIAINHMEIYEDIKDNLLESAPDRYKQNYNLALAQQDDLTDKNITGSVLKNESKNIENNLDALQSVGIDKIRSAEINTYYAEKYRDQTTLVKMLILIGVVLLFITILKKKGILSEGINNILVAIVIVVGCYFVGIKIYNYYRRDNMNYQEFDYSDDVKPEHVDDYEGESIWDYDKNQLDNLDIDINFDHCIGHNCCSDNQRFDDTAQKCVDKHHPHKQTDNTENFSPAAYNTNY